MAQRATDRTGRDTLFVGVDTSGSFVQGGDYGNAISFLAYYIYGHLHGLGGLSQVKELFVAAIGGKEGGEPKAFHPILEFQGKDIAGIQANLRGWYPLTDPPTHFSGF